MLTKLHFYILQPVASTINTLAGALYKMFNASHDTAWNEMRQACSTKRMWIWCWPLDTFIAFKLSACG